MYPVLLKIGGIELHAVVVFAILSSITFLFAFWLQSQKDLKNFSIFDIAFFTLITGFILSRLGGFVVNLGSYLEQGWSLLPLSESEEGIRFFQKLPWSFFKITDTNFLFIGILLGAILAMLLIYRNSNQLKSINVLLDRVVMSYAFAMIVLLIGIYLEGNLLGKPATGQFSVVYPDGVSRYPLPLFQIGVLILAIIIKLILHFIKLKKSVVNALAMIIVIGAGEILLRLYAANYSPNVLGIFDVYQLMALTVIVLAVLTQISVIRPKLQKRLVGNADNIRPQPRIPRTAMRRVTQNVEPFSPKRFVMSFSDRIKNDLDDNN